MDQVPAGLDHHTPPVPARPCMPGGPPARAEEWTTGQKKSPILGKHFFQRSAPKEKKLISSLLSPRHSASPCLKISSTPPTAGGFPAGSASRGGLSPSSSALPQSMLYAMPPQSAASQPPPPPQQQVRSAASPATFQVTHAMSSVSLSGSPSEDAAARLGGTNKRQRLAGCFFLAKTPLGRLTETKLNDQTSGGLVLSGG